MAFAWLAHKSIIAGQIHRTSVLARSLTNQTVFLVSSFSAFVSFGARKRVRLGHCESLAMTYSQVVQETELVDEKTNRTIGSQMTFYLEPAVAKKHRYLTCLPVANGRLRLIT
jgi:hypothetical protein